MNPLLPEQSKLFESINLDEMPEKQDSVTIKSAYYQRSLALELLPRLIEMLNTPDKLPFFPYATHKLKGRSLQMKISQAWSYLNDHTEEIRSYISRRAGPKAAESIPFEELKMLRATVEICRLDAGVVLRRRTDRLKGKTTLDKKEVENPDENPWEEKVYAWLENIDTQDTPLHIKDLVLSISQIEKLRRVLSAMEELECVITPTAIHIERKRQ